jgi:hypothetical protein
VTGQDWALGPAGGLGWWDAVLRREWLANLKLEVAWQAWTMAFAVVGTGCACAVVYARSLYKK